MSELSAVSPLDEKEYLVKEILGLQVVTEDGEYLGEIVDVYLLPANDVYVVRHGESEILLPAIEDVVKKIDLERRTLVAVRIEGLW